jgi:hypothetical protein
MRRDLIFFAHGLGVVGIILVEQIQWLKLVLAIQIPKVVFQRHLETTSSSEL